MAFENLFIRTKRYIGDIQLDAVISETHNNSIKLTKNPVELGADITDHAIIEPKRINIIGQVSDTPLGLAAVNELVDTVTGLFSSSTSNALTRSNAAYNAVVQLMEQRELIDIQTKLVLYKNMVITSLNITQDKDTSRVALMNITCEEVLIAETQIIQLDSEQLQAGSTREQASASQNKGRQEQITPDETTSKSALKSITGWLAG